MPLPRRAAPFPNSRMHVRQSPPTMSFQKVFPWLLRAAWVALPFTAGPAIEAAVRQHSTPVQVVAAVGLWGAWGLGLVATLVPHPIGLTALRIAAPATFAAAVAAAV